MSLISRKQVPLSVVLPVYNAERYLRQAISSVSDQTYTNFELIIIDDGSKDRSLEIISYFAGKDERIRYISRENQGLIATLNEGVEMADSPLIARMDADDICEPNRFELQVDYLENHPECVAVGSQVMLIDPEGAPICPFKEPLSHELIDQGNLSSQLGSRMFHPTVIMRKAVLQRIGGYRREFKHAEDVDLFLRMAEQGRLANLSETLLCYRQHLESVGYKHKQIQRESARKAVIEARVRRGLDLIPETDEVAELHSEESKSMVHCKWAWWALKGGYNRTARKHSIRAVLMSPFKFLCWKALFCAVRGH